jgi:hypothetical protein
MNRAKALQPMVAERRREMQVDHRFIPVVGALGPSWRLNCEIDPLVQPLAQGSLVGGDVGIVLHVLNQRVEPALGGTPTSHSVSPLGVGLTLKARAAMSHAVPLVFSVSMFDRTIISKSSSG